MKTRMIRVNDEITRVVADVVRFELSDPRIGTVCSVLRAETTSDLKYCKIMISVLGDERQREETMTALKKAAGFIRKRTAEIINLRNTPEIKFVLDDSIEHGMKMAKLIEEVCHPVKREGIESSDL